MTMTTPDQAWRNSGSLGNRDHAEYGGCVAEQDIRVPVEFMPDGTWHAGLSVVDGYPLDAADEWRTPRVLCGETDDCGQVATRAEAKPLPNGPELAVALLRGVIKRRDSAAYLDCDTIKQLRGLLDLARAMPDSLLTRKVRALFDDDGHEQAWDSAPLPLAQLWTSRPLTTERAKPGDADEPAPLTPDALSPGTWIMAPDSSDPFGGRKIPREVAEAYPEESGGSVGRWVIRFAGDYLYPSSLITAIDHKYRVTAPHVPDRAALATRFLRADGENISDQPAPHLGANLIHVSDRAGKALAMLDLDPAHLPSRTWRLVPGFADVPTHWYGQRWINAEAAIHWVWDEIQSLTT